MGYDPAGRGHRVLGFLSSYGETKLGRMFGLIHPVDLTPAKRKRLAKLLKAMATEGLIYEVAGAYSIAAPGRALLADLDCGIRPKERA